VSGSRRLSQAISEGDGISLIASVGSLEEARLATDGGAEGLVVSLPEPGLRDASPLPILWRGGSPHTAQIAAADACVIVVGSNDEAELEELHAQVVELGLEAVAEVRDEEELELALERLDPEIFLLSSGAADDDEDPLDRVLALLPDVPAGKLAIAEVASMTREDVAALERAGVDGVLVDAERVAELAGDVTNTV
jgi:indole-3-glycerol phosphate synthase